MSRIWLIAVGGGCLAALASLAALTGSPWTLLVTYLAPLPIFLLGLGLGPGVAAAGGICGVIVVGLLAGPVAAMLFWVVDVMPAWLVVGQVLRRQPLSDGEKWFPLGSVAGWLAIMVAGGFLATAGGATLWADGIRDLVTGELEAALDAMMPSAEESARERMVEALSALFPAAAGISWLLMIVINGLLAQGILLRTARALRPALWLERFQVPEGVSWLMVSAAAMALADDGDLGYTARNGVLILGMPFFFAGLVLVHDWARRMAFSTVVLAAFYFILMVSGWPALLVAGWGMVDQWAGGIRPGREEE